MQFEYYGEIINVIEGEAISNAGTNQLIYLARCECNENVLLITRDVPCGRAIENHVAKVMEEIQPKALEYLMQKLSQKGKYYAYIVSTLCYPSAFFLFPMDKLDEIKQMPNSKLAGWSVSCHDFAAPQYLYTEIIGGHQQRIAIPNLEDTEFMVYRREIPPRKSLREEFASLQTGEEKLKLLQERIEEYAGHTTEMDRILRYRFGLEDGKVHTREDTAVKFDVSANKVRHFERQLFRAFEPPRERRLLDHL